MLIEDVPQILRAVAPMRGHVDGAVLRVGLVDEHDALLRLDSTTQLAQAVARAHVVAAFHTCHGGAAQEDDDHVRGIDERLKCANVVEVVHICHTAIEHVVSARCNIP